MTLRPRIPVPGDLPDQTALPSPTNKTPPSYPGVDLSSQPMADLTPWRGVVTRPIRMDYRMTDRSYADSAQPPFNGATVQVLENDQSRRVGQQVPIEPFVLPSRRLEPTAWRGD